MDLDNKTKDKTHDILGVYGDIMRIVWVNCASARFEGAICEYVKVLSEDRSR